MLLHRVVAHAAHLGTWAGQLCETVQHACSGPLHGKAAEQIAPIVNACLSPFTSLHCCEDLERAVRDLTPPNVLPDWFRVLP